MRRYAITLGSPTTSGGKVITASSAMSLPGGPIALEGDTAFCAKCGHEGKIVCVGPRLPESWMGRQIALLDDVCVCRCSEPPKLIPTQALKFQELSTSSDSVASSTTSTHSDAGEARAAPGVLDECFRIVGANGSPCSGIRYRVRSASGHSWDGRTDDQGFTQRVSTREPEQLTVELLNDADVRTC
jgi:uncharacterized Zn-binding protein involved in type VI secretion